MLSILSVEPEEYTNLQKKFSEQHFSIGLHPWNINEAYEEELRRLSLLIEEGNVVAIGEIGLDKLKAATEEAFALQQKVFEAQLTIAKESGLPIIIHNVRSTSEILSALTKLKITNPVIFHGFRQKKEIAEQIVAKGHYLSFGNQHNKKAMSAIPLDRLFLETDDNEALISEIYESAANTLGVTISNLTENIKKNYKRLFCRPK